MFKRIRQYNYIRKIRKCMEEESMIKWLKLNTIETSATVDLLIGRITSEFYRSVFTGGDINNHYSEVNAEYIKNYRF